MSSKNAKNSEQNESSQQQANVQSIESEQIQPQQSIAQQPNQGEQPQPPQALQNQAQYQYVYVNYSRKGNVIGLSIVYTIGLLFAIGFPIGLFSMNGSIKDFSNETDYYLIQVVKVVMPVVLSMSVISSIILWIAYLSSKNKTVAKIAAACTLSVSVISFVVFWIYLNFYSVVGFGDAAFFLPMPFGVMILGIAWCVNVFKYQNEKPAYFANNSLNGQYVVSSQYPNQPSQYPNQPPQYQYPPQQQSVQYPQQPVQYPPQQLGQYSQQQGQTPYPPVSQQYPQNATQYPYDYNKK